MAQNITNQLLEDLLNDDIEYKSKLTIKAPASKLTLTTGSAALKRMQLKPSNS